MIEEAPPSITTGKLVEWNDERGFGWAESDVDGQQKKGAKRRAKRAFAHIKQFEKGQPRPQCGDIVRYRMGNDERGRPRATGIRLQRKSEAIGLTRWLLLGLLLALPLVMGATLPVSGSILPLALLVMSIITWFTYRDDKRRAQAKEWRVPEATLHSLELLGGWPGAFLAQKRFRHKISKGPFLFVFWCIVLLWQVVSVEMISGGSLRRAILDWLSSRGLD